MIAARPVKAFPPRAIVGVIADRLALQRAQRLRQPPDFFELRLDALIDFLPELERALPSLGAPLIITARNSAQGGAGDLSVQERRELLQHFLPHASALDLELRTAENFRKLIAETKARKILLIISVHEFCTSSLPDEWQTQLEVAKKIRADLFKIAVRTDTSAEFVRLKKFCAENLRNFPLAAMGVGKFGAHSRRELFRLGSFLNYAALSRANAPGQLNLRQLRQLQKSSTPRRSSV